MIGILYSLLLVLVYGFAGCSASTVWIYPLSRRDTGGPYMKVQTGGSPQVRSVSFTGSSQNDPSTEIHLEKSDVTLVANAFKYREGKNDYYLSAESGGKVLFRKLNGFPTQHKYFFRVQKVSSSFYAFKSVETGEYLHGDPNGRAFLKAVPSSAFYNNKPQDRYTWFKILFRNYAKNSG